MRKSIPVLTTLVMFAIGSSEPFADHHGEGVASLHDPSLTLLDQFIEQPSIRRFKILTSSLNRTAKALGTEGVEKLARSQREKDIILYDAMEMFSCPFVLRKTTSLCGLCFSQFYEFTNGDDDKVSMNDPNVYPWSVDAFSELDACYNREFSGSGGNFLPSNFKTFLQALGRLTNSQ